mgnify:CR=1 FL=1
MKKLLILLGMFIIAIKTYAIHPVPDWITEKMVLTSRPRF